VLAAKDYIRAGDAFQIVLSQRFDLDLGRRPFDVYRVLRQVNPSPYMFYLRRGRLVDWASPEPLVQASRRPRHLAADRGHPNPAARPRRRTARSAPNSSSTPRSVPSTSCWWTLARTTSERVVRFGTEHVEEFMTLERYAT